MPSNSSFRSSLRSSVSEEEEVALRELVDSQGWAVLQRFLAEGMEVALANLRSQQELPELCRNQGRVEVWERVIQLPGKLLQTRRREE